MSEACRVPLIDLLGGVPPDARILIVEDGGMSSHSIPVGRYSAEAAAELRRLSAAEADFHMAYRMKCDEETKRLQAEVEALRKELETERMRLAACGVVALADTPESASKARDMLPQYRSASCDDVARRVDECMNLRGYAEELRKALDPFARRNFREDDFHRARTVMAARPGGEG